MQAIALKESPTTNWGDRHLTYRVISVYTLTRLP
jgi:hypothetical protein